MKSKPLNKHTIPPEDITEYAPEAVRRRIRRRWEQRRAETAGRSEAYTPRGYYGGEKILSHRELYVIPAREEHIGAWGQLMPARPEKPRPPQSVYVRLVRP